MGTAFNKLLRIGSAATFFALITPACVDNNVTLFVRQVQAPDPENGCVAVNDPSGVAYSTGALDTTLSSEYAAWLLVGNQMVTRGDEDTLRPESSRIQLYEADVELFDSGGGTLSSFSIPISGFVDVGSGTEPGWGLARVTMVDGATGASLGGQQTLISRVTLFGVTLGDIEVETAPFDFPIEACSGCFACACPESAEAAYAPSCSPGQNEPVDCRLAACWSSNFCGCPVQ